MSIKGDVHELNLINAEIKRLSTHLRELRKSAKEANSRIAKYLEEKEQPGVKYKGNAVVLEHSTKRIGKKKKDQEEDALQVLRDNGVHNARDVLDQILEARRGETVDYNKIKIKRLPDS